MSNQYKFRECEELKRRINELERDLLFANDAIAKGDLARQNAGGMEIRIQELERELLAEQARGQEVHDYLVSVNPDNSLLSVLESVIQQREIENRFRERVKKLEHENAELREKVKNQY